MIRKTVIFLGFFFTVVLLAMGLVMVGALNLVLNGYHPECGIWRNVVPFACTPKKEPSPRSFEKRPEPRQRAASTAAPRKPAAKNPPARAAAPPAPVRQHARICDSYQPEPYRVQCDPETGFCYHDPGFRGACGLADNR